MPHQFKIAMLCGVAALVSACRTQPPAGPAELYVTQRGKGGMVFTPQSGGANTVDSKFEGKDRAHPKTSIDPAPLEPEFTSLEALFETLPADQDMQEQLEGLSEESGDPRAKFAETRLPDEQRNVRVRAWLYAVKSESDKDFHCIIGSSRTKSKAQFLNVEVSGLPKQDNADTATLRNVREQLNSLLTTGLPGGSAYLKLKTPVAVEVQGSLFYDIDHEAGVVGPLDMRPTTAWEIHPITDLHKGHN